MSEAISTMAVRIEYLNKTIDDQRAKKDEYKAVLSQQLLGVAYLYSKLKFFASEMCIDRYGARSHTVAVQDIDWY
ncbi:hypothetical protein KFK09_019513 [Dendrobium nobile]|uniref:Uncharacterized protein n=1 Tax=Dendrobium nobile TaxID=94219 RepID=A0A8T3AQE9_DENNO|nr:hypothetical protein KFK09_019513 [Dendrobium nobile]